MISHMQEKNILFLKTDIATCIPQPHPPSPNNILFVRICVYWLHINETQPETQNHLLVSG